MPALSSYPTVAAVPNVDRVLITEDAGVLVLDPQDIDGTEFVVVVTANGTGARVPITAFGLGVAPQRDPLALALGRSPTGTLTAGDPLTLTSSPTGGLGPYQVRLFADGEPVGGVRSVPAGGSDVTKLPAQLGTVLYSASVVDALGSQAVSQSRSVTATAGGGGTPDPVPAATTDLAYSASAADPVPAATTDLAYSA